MAIKCTSLGKEVFYITYYDNPGITKSGYKAGKGAVAVRYKTGVCDQKDWKLQPRKPKKGDCWHEFEIPGYGRGKAQDVGCLVTDRHRSDIWLSDEKEYNKWVEYVKKKAGATIVNITEFCNKYCGKKTPLGCDKKKLKKHTFKGIVKIEVEVFECCMV